MRRKKILELPFLHSNLRGRVLYLEYINPKIISIESRLIERILETPETPLPFKPGDFDSFYINCSNGSGNIEILMNEILRISSPGSVVLLKMFESKEFPVLKKTFEEKGYIFDKSLKIPYLRKFWGPRKCYSTFNYFKLVEEQPKKKISVVIPMFNNAHSIQRAVDSVAKQTYPIEEVIIVNDGSTDNSQSVVENIKSTSQLKIKLFNQKNAGPSCARNIGIKNATGEMVAFLDADDWWLPEKIATQVRILESLPEAGLVSCNRNNEMFPHFLIFGFGNFVRLPLKLLLIKNFCPTPTVLVHRSILEKILFDESMTHLEDLDMWIRISKSYDCYLLNKSLVTTGDGKPNFGHSGLSRNIFLMELGELKCILKVKRDQFISFFEYFLFSTYSFLKFIRRIFIVLQRH
ncbi:MAG: glycosyltransferase family 2 protein [Bacteriovoracaceae bacterium]|nr:glycosyltransferase family 2 protein [Bacteriovoracaceae bacterium]